jgi:hypothetical protein
MTLFTFFVKKRNKSCLRPELKFSRRGDYRLQLGYGLVLQSLDLDAVLRANRSITVDNKDQFNNPVLGTL